MKHIVIFCLMVFFAPFIARCQDTLKVERCSISLNCSIDNSGSMSNGFSQPISPFQIALKFSSVLASQLDTTKDSLVIQYQGDSVPFLGTKISNSYFNPSPKDWNDLYGQLLDSNFGILNIAKQSTRQQKIVVFLTDAQTDGYTKINGQFAEDFSPLQLQQCIDTCLKYGIKFFAIFTANEYQQYSYQTKKTFQTLADTTGGATYTVINDSLISSTTEKIFAQLNQKECSISAKTQCGDALFLQLMEGKNPIYAISPNPTTNYVLVSSNDSGTVEIYSISGEKIFEGQTNKIIDLSQLRSGTYFIYLKINYCVFRSKFILLR